MKVRTSMVLKLFSVALPVSILMAACNKDDASNAGQTVYNLSGNASAAKENQATPVVSAATGTVTGTYDRTTHLLTYNVNWTGLTDSAIAAHFHGQADSTQNAGVLIPITITAPGPTGSGSGSVTVADSVANFFLDGRMYYNVHTKKYPAGEIRSQVTLR